MSAGEHLRAAMHTVGLDHPGELINDGKLHRFKTEGDHNRNSWYVLRSGTPAAGAFGCWRRGIKEAWCEKCRENYTATEWRTIRENWKRAEVERERTETERHAKAQKIAAWLLSRARPVTTHAYLAAKGVRASAYMREYWGALVLPLRDVCAELHSLQFIGAAGDKRFLSGGRCAGYFFTLADKPDGALVICEGYATGASVHEATGFAVVCALNCGNLLAVAQALREKFPVREIIICADNDQFTDGNPGTTKATEAAKTIRARLAVPQFADTSTKPTDFNDLHKLEGLDIVKAQIENAATPKETDEELFQRLAKLTHPEYDRVRDDEADRAGVRIGTLDSEVAKRRPKDEMEDATQGSKVYFPELEPWPQPVNGAELLNEIAVTLERFVVAPEPAIIAASLFVLHTYTFDLGDISPILFITGPTKRCGKSKFLAILLRLVSRPFAAASATAAGIYRMIELHHPTLCIDEVDAFVHGDEQLRGLINSGHTRDAAFHLGCAATADKDFEPRRWSTWTPKIFSGIGRLADTIEDRSIIIKMVRRRKDEPCERLRHGTRFDDIPQKALKFVNDHTEVIRNSNPSPPDALHDRAADNWTPLLILADQAGGDWPAKARQAAVVLSGGDDGESLGLNGQLLADIRDVFAAAGADKLASKDMAERLAQIEGRPWAEFGKQRRPISPNQLANLLRGFGVLSRTIRVGDSTAKGYDMAGFSDAFSRWLPGNRLLKGNKVTLSANIEESPLFQKVTAQACDVSENGVSANKDAGCYVVTFQNAEKEEMLL
jgi:putative DNA primase/helicase